MLLKQYVRVNTCFPKAEYSASGCLWKEFEVARWKMKNRTNSSSSNLAHELTGKMYKMNQKLKERKKEEADCLTYTLLLNVMMLKSAKYCPS